MAVVVVVVVVVLIAVDAVTSIYYSKPLTAYIYYFCNSVKIYFTFKFL